MTYTFLTIAATIFLTISCLGSVAALYFLQKVIRDMIELTENLRLTAQIFYPGKEIGRDGKVREIKPQVKVSAEWDDSLGEEAVGR